MIASLFLQSPIPVPGPDTEPWPWVAFLAVCALSYITVRHLNSVEGDRKEWKDTAKAVVPELKANTAALDKNNDALEGLGGTVGKLDSTVNALDRRMERHEDLLRQLIAAQGRGSK